MAGVEGEGVSPDKWVVVGLSGVTRGGKTTLALDLLSSLPSTTAYLSQDEYILPNDDPAHPAAPAPLEGINKETLASIDMKRMMQDLHCVLTADSRTMTLSDPGTLMERSQVVGCALRDPRPPLRGRHGAHNLPGVLVLDGIRLFEHPELPSLCHLRYFLTLSREQCMERGKGRLYTSPFINSPLYFDLCVWAKYEEYLAMVADGEGKDDIRFLDGASPPNTLAQTVKAEVLSLIKPTGQCS